MRTGTARIAAVVAATLLATFAAPAGEEPLAPRAAIEYLQAELLACMKSGGSVAERVERLTPVVEKTHDLPYISRVVLGSRWRGMEKETQSEFVKLFGRFCVASYASNFGSWDGQRFEIVGEETPKEGQSLIRTKIVGDEEHTLDYLLVERDGRWRIANVVADGVSDLALKRAEYSSIWEAEGYEGLVAKLSAKIDEIMAGAGDVR